MPGSWSLVEYDRFFAMHPRKSIILRSALATWKCVCVRVSSYRFVSMTVIAVILLDIRFFVGPYSHSSSSVISLRGSVRRSIDPHCRLQHFSCFCFRLSYQLQHHGEETTWTVSERRHLVAARTTLRVVTSLRTCACKGEDAKVGGHQAESLVAYLVAQGPCCRSCCMDQYPYDARAHQMSGSVQILSTCVADFTQQSIL